MHKSPGQQGAGGSCSGCRWLARAMFAAHHCRCGAALAMHHTSVSKTTISCKCFESWTRKAGEWGVCVQVALCSAGRSQPSTQYRAAACPPGQDTATGPPSPPEPLPCRMHSLACATAPDLTAGAIRPLGGAPCRNISTLYACWRGLLACAPGHQWRQQPAAAAAAAICTSGGACPGGQTGAAFSHVSLHSACPTPKNSAGGHFVICWPFPMASAGLAPQAARPPSPDHCLLH
jgi:hypothetical protein